MELGASEAQRALSYAINRLIDTLQAWDPPWLCPERHRADAAEIALFEQALNFSPDPKRTRLMASWIAGVDIEEDDELRESSIATVVGNGGGALARAVLSTLGVTADENSRLFVELSIELARLQVAIQRVLLARSKGDSSAVARLTTHYTRTGHISSEKPQSQTPTISHAWKEYVGEKTNAKPRAAWSDKNARTQAATFTEFQEIVGDIQVGEITRDDMLTYRNTVARLPSNRQKKYPGKSIAELLAMDVPVDQLPAARTIDEKLIRIGAFLKWCRDIKGYLTTDPLRGVHVEHDSKRYALFNQDDLRKLFNSPDYERGEHSRSWRYWIPLIALYTGARQTEIAQLLVRNVITEDGVWIFAITDEARDDQKVKTSAGVRKVPVSSKLKALGFLDYVAHLKARGEIRLFPDLKKGRDGWGHYVSRWFGEEYKSRVAIEPDSTGGRKVFHSFRHTAITKALSSGQPLAHVQQVFGHEKSLLGESATYMHAFPVAQLVPVVESLDYGLDHSAYEQSWRRYVERWHAAESVASDSTLKAA